MLNKKSIAIENYTDDNRIYICSGQKVRHLATIHANNRRFIVYSFRDENYIEELITTKVSDKIFGSDKIVYIENENLWRMLFLILQKEGIL